MSFVPYRETTLHTVKGKEPVFWLTHKTFYILFFTNKSADLNSSFIRRDKVFCTFFLNISDELFIRFWPFLTMVLLQFIPGWAWKQHHATAILQTIIQQSPPFPKWLTETVTSPLYETAQTNKQALCSH